MDFGCVVLIKEDHSLRIPAYFNPCDLFYHEVVQAAVLLIHDPNGMYLVYQYLLDGAFVFQYDPA